MTFDWIKLGGIAAVVFGLVMGAVGLHHHVYKQGYEAGAAAVQKQFDAAKEAAEAKRLADVEAAKKEGDRRVASQTENTNEAIQQAQRATADATAAHDAAVQLQQRIDGLVRAARAANNSATVRSGPSQQGGDPLDVLVNVLSRTSRAAEIASGYADKLRTAGLKCERDYDSLTAAK